MMIKDILFMPGKSGLFKLVSRGANFTIVESLTDKKRTTAHDRDKIGMITDVYIHTTGDKKEVSVIEVFHSIKEKEGGKAVPIDMLKTGADELRAYFAEILPDFDRKRVYPTNMIKVLTWYNLLIDNGITDFLEKELEEVKVKE